MKEWNTKSIFHIMHGSGKGGLRNIKEDKTMDYVTLNNGVKMPQLGYGVYQTPPEETERCVLAAIKTDTAALTLLRHMVMKKA